MSKIDIYDDNYIGTEDKLTSILHCFYGHNYAIIVSKKGVKSYAIYYAY